MAPVFVCTWWLCILIPLLLGLVLVCCLGTCAFAAYQTRKKRQARAALKAWYEREKAKAASAAAAAATRSPSPPMVLVHLDEEIPVEEPALVTAEEEEEEEQEPRSQPSWRDDFMRELRTTFRFEHTFGGKRAPLSWQANTTKGAEFTLQEDADLTREQKRERAIAEGLKKL